GQATGDIPADRDPESTARFLANTYFGLQTTAKLCLPTEVSDDVVDETLRILS
ncbi:MAG: TetR family transcriptional regulator, partial [Bacteroidetes bacterium QH_6_64_77]